MSQAAGFNAKRYLKPFRVGNNSVMQGRGTDEPSAILQLDDMNGSLLVSRFTTADRDEFIHNPADGLLIYNKDIHLFQFWNGTEWTNLSNGPIDGTPLWQNGATRAMQVGLVSTHFSYPIPAGSTIIRAMFQVTTPYNNGATISIGTLADPELYLPAGRIDETTLGIYINSSAFPVAVDTTTYITIWGTPSLGSGLATVEYGLTL